MKNTKAEIVKDLLGYYNHNMQKQTKGNKNVYSKWKPEKFK